MRRRDLLLVLCLLLLTVACFLPAGSLGYINFDDYDYVRDNAVVHSGLNSQSLVWAFASAHRSNWHPLTWMSLMLDCDLFGVNPHEQHAVNIGLHALNSALLFLWLRALIGARWRAFFVAALFALHPLHVESVAWISERKDVLSAFFFLLLLIVYTRYCRRQPGGKLRWVCVLLALGLMSKPMLVTVPLVLILLDFWPLKRLQSAEAEARPANGVRNVQKLIVEKIPLFALCLISSIITLWSQHGSGTMMALGDFSVWTRCLHAVMSCSLYLGKIFWPVNLAIYYPLSLANPNALAVLGSLLLLVAITFVAIRWRHTLPWLLLGWVWFLIMLLPVIGIVQVGLQSIADRYMYLPSIGLFIAIVWTLSDLVTARPTPTPSSTHSSLCQAEVRLIRHSRIYPATLAALGSLCLLACFFVTRHQIGFWRDNFTLYKRVLTVSPKNNWLGFLYLGYCYSEVGQYDCSCGCLATALKIYPNLERARLQLGNDLLLRQRFAAAQPYWEAEVKVRPQDYTAHANLGQALAGQRKFAAAQVEYQIALQLGTNDIAPRQLFNANAPKAAAEQTLNELAGQLQMNQCPPEIHARAAGAYEMLGRYGEAVQQYRLALAQSPDATEWLNNLAWLLATCPGDAIRNGPEAVRLAQHACELTKYETTMYLGTLAAAQAEAGQFTAAVSTAQKACDNAQAKGETDLLVSNHRLLELYQSQQPFHSQRN